MIIIDRGRNIQERSAILIEDGIFKGYAFFDLNYQVNNIDILKNIIIPMKSNRDSKNIILSYLKKRKSLKPYLFKTFSKFDVNRQLLIWKSLKQKGYEISFMKLSMKPILHLVNFSTSFCYC